MYDTQLNYIIKSMRQYYLINNKNKPKMNAKKKFSKLVNTYFMLIYRNCSHLNTLFIDLN
jgi:hypothetical protein